MISELFEQIKSTSSATERKKMLESNLNETIKLIFDDCYNKNRQYYVKKIEKKAPDLFSSCSYTIDENYNLFHELLNDLASQNSNSDANVTRVQDTISMFKEADQEILVSILNRNLKIGITNTVMMKLLGTEKDEFNVSLAVNLDKTNINPITGEYFASRKLDGVRCVAFVKKEGGVVSKPVFKSRQNKEFTTLDLLKEPVRQLASGLPDGSYVFDGECCIIDENGDEHFDWIMREIKRKDHTIARPCYNIFDLLTEDEFNMRVESSIFSERLNKINVLYAKYLAVGNPNFIHVLEQERINSQEDFDRWTNKVQEGHWEGFMLRKDVAYLRGRSTDLLKVKKFQDAEYTVLDVETGRIKYGTEEFDVVSNIIIEHKGNRVSVGSGLSKEQRLSWFNHPEDIIGKTVTIQYFEETHNKVNDELSLRFPVLKYVYDGERDM